MRLLLIPFLLLGVSVHASEYANSLGGFYVDPHVAVGASSVQGTTFLLGVDVGYMVTDQISAGVGVFGQFGETPSRDRILGGGPFAQFIQPVTPFLTFSAREDIDYVDVRRPYDDTYETLTGLASFTTVALHLKLAHLFGVTGGYRAALGLSDPDLGKGRSMPFLGFSIGF
jgi:hypothetical protein